MHLDHLRQKDSLSYNSVVTLQSYMCSSIVPPKQLYRIPQIYILYSIFSDFNFPHSICKLKLYFSMAVLTRPSQVRKGNKSGNKPQAGRPLCKTWSSPLYLETTECSNGPAFSLLDGCFLHTDSDRTAATPP